MSVVVKLGSRVVAEPDGTVRGDVLDLVCTQVAELHGDGEQVVLVTSGSIARGIGVMGHAARPGAIDALQALSAVGQGPLFAEYQRRLAARSVTGAQVLLTAFDMEARRHYVNVRATLERLLAWRVVPVVNENDTTATDEITFGDNDFLAAQVAVLLHARLLVLLTDLQGLYTADPHRDASARLIERVDDPAELEGISVGPSASGLGTGGMQTKVGAARVASAAGSKAVVCDGTAPGNLSRAVRGEPVGTRFAPAARGASSFKLWLRHAKPARGAVVVDEGAARVLRAEGRSLLPVGIVGVSGSFAAGDAVEVQTPSATIGKGITNYASGELLRIKGLKTEQVRELMPHAADEAIHRDEFVLTGDG